MPCEARNPKPTPSPSQQSLPTPRSPNPKTWGRRRRMTTCLPTPSLRRRNPLRHPNNRNPVPPIWLRSVKIRKPPLPRSPNRLPPRHLPARTPPRKPNHRPQIPTQIRRKPHEDYSTQFSAAANPTRPLSGATQTGGHRGAHLVEAQNQCAKITSTCPLRNPPVQVITAPRCWPVISAGRSTRSTTFWW